MKTTLLVISISLAAVLGACGKAAEDRDAMMTRSKVFQDSIATVIRASMDEAAAPAPGGPAQVMVLPAGAVQTAPPNGTPAPNQAVTPAQNATITGQPNK